MLSTFFNKSKPINFIVIGLYMILLYAIAMIKNGFKINYTSAIVLMGGLIAYILSMLVLNWIIQRNDITQKSTNTILLFAFFTVILPSALVNPYVLLSNLFILCAIRSILLLKEEKHIKSNIFNASLWIGLASIMYFWSIAFILVLYVAIFYFSPKNYRNWVIPIVGIITVLLLANVYMLLVYDTLFYITQYVDKISLVYDYFSIKKNIFSVGLLGICLLFFFSVFLTKYKRRSAKTKPVLKLIIAYLFIAILVLLIVPEKNTAEMVFLASPLAIMGTSYLEMKQNQLVKEINIWVFVLMPFITLLF